MKQAWSLPYNVSNLIRKCIITEKYTKILCAIKATKKKYRVV